MLFFKYHFYLDFMNIFRGNSCVLIVVTFLFFQSSCSELSRMTYRNPIVDGIPLVASHAIISSYASIDTYRDLADAGFNMAYINFSSIGDVTISLSLAERCNVKLLVACPDFEGSDLKAYAKVKSYKSFAGIRVADEPSIKEFKNIEDKLNSYRENHYSHLLFVNLFPNYASKKQLGVAEYEEYVDKYLTIVKPEFLSFDNYPILKNGLREGYFENLEIISRKCKIRGIPFWGYVLSSSFDNYSKPTKGTMAFQAYSNLAYGAQGLSFFTYKRYNNPNIKLVMSSSPVDETYNLTETYYLVKELNSELAYYAQYLHDSEVFFVKHLRNGRYDFKRHAIRSVICGEKGVLVSDIHKRNKHYVLIVNKDYENYQTITVKPRLRLQSLEYSNDDNIVFGDIRNFYVKPGEALLFLVK